MIPDNAPGIALTKNPERTNRGAMKLTYFVQDDYGVASAVRLLESIAAGLPTVQPTSSLLVFRLDREWLAWPSAACQEIAESRPVHRVVK